MSILIQVISIENVSSDSAGSFCIHACSHGSCDKIICAVHDDVLIKGGVLISRVVLWHIFFIIMYSSWEEYMH